MHRLRLLLAVVAIALLAAVGTGAAGGGGPQARAEATPHIASGFDFVKYVSGSPACSGPGFRLSFYWLKVGECGYTTFQVSDSDFEQSTVIVRFLGPDNRRISQALATPSTSTIDGVTSWSAPIRPATTWPSGAIKVEVTVFGDPAPAGIGQFYMNHLEATVGVAPSPDGRYMPGDPLLVTGTISQVDTVAAGTQPIRGVPARFYLKVSGPGGVTKGPYGPYTAASNGTFSQGLPRAATSAFAGTYETNFKSTITIEVINATYTDPLTGPWIGESAGSTPVELVTFPDRLFLENSFVSSVGWVKPGDTYPFRVFVKNFREQAASNTAVTIPAVDGTTFKNLSPGAGTAAVNPDGSITWNIGEVPAGEDGNPAIVTLVGEAQADDLTQDPQVVWKNLSSTASLSYTGAPAGITSTSLGPKVIPPDEAFDTARYGFRPFPVVPVDYFDRTHTSNHTAEGLNAMINSPDIPGSTYNLYQEMSFGQLAPHGTVPSAGIASAGWDVAWNSPERQQNGFEFTQLAPTGACTGLTYDAAANTPVYSERIASGWYQLPGDTGYYGSDQYTAAGSQAGARAGVGAIFQIDNACGPTAKAVYDAAHIADPEIDYSDYDTDKDGVVDFFMMVFAGAGGNGESLTAGGYDNIWPHSSSLEFTYTDPETGLTGYVSDDQLKDLEGNLLYYTDDTRIVMTTDVTPYPVFVRVGPYNVNPETAIDHASVISHEYGHSLGLPDFYSHGTRTTYGDWTLMATDKSQHMDVFSKQEMGWIVPRVLPAGETVVNDWHDSKYDTQEIEWVQPDGTPYTLTGPGIHNGEAYVAKLPGRQIIDPAIVEAGASPSHLWWSGSGNGFGCTPQGAHNMDIALPQLASVAPGTPITVTFKSYWTIEWDYDYGFVMTSTDGGRNYTALPSANGYTTPMANNPYANGCQARYGNGITGTSGSYAAGTEAVDRLTNTYPEGGFVEDSYDLSAAAGSPTVLRFSYATDPGLAKKGWFIDDLKVMAGDQVIYETDFEDGAGDPAIYNGGCQDTTRTAPVCTKGWAYVNSAADSQADHAYYMEMRDRSGFDLDGNGQNDRDALAFEPGLLLVYTDENHGYGNFGTDDPPAQSPVDAAPQPGVNAPNLNDASFTGTRSHYSDSDPGYVDNYLDETGGNWTHLFNCLSFDVLSMSGNGLGPATAPGDLVGSVRFNIGPGCVDFDYGFGTTSDQPPVANVQMKPSTVRAGESFLLDGSGSRDDHAPPEQLTYWWDFDGDGRLDGDGSPVWYAINTPGAHNITLEVTDPGGQKARETITIDVLP